MTGEQQRHRGLNSGEPSYNLTANKVLGLRKKAEPLADRWEVNKKAQPLADSHIRTGNHIFHIIGSRPPVSD